MAITPYHSGDTIYRDFHITPSYMFGYDYTHDDYDGAPDSNDHRYGTCKTIQECKEEIDIYYAENIQIRVVRNIPNAGPTITKFVWMKDAIEFASKVRGEVKFFLHGFEYDFDSI